MTLPLATSSQVDAVSPTPQAKALGHVVSVRGSQASVGIPADSQQTPEEKRATVGKFLGCSAAARLCGMSWADAGCLGIMMNTRALMEVIVINIGYDMGFIPQKVFTMLVVMAVVTTVMTGPLLKLLLRRSGHAIPVGVEA